MIYHIISDVAWQEQLHAEFIEVSSLQTERFIHCCTQQQIEGVLLRYFKGQTGLLILEIDEALLQPELRYEESTQNELFPHVYGPINRNAIRSVKKVN